MGMGPLLLGRLEGVPQWPAEAKDALSIGEEVIKQGMVGSLPDPRVGHLNIFG